MNKDDNFCIEKKKKCFKKDAIGIDGKRICCEIEIRQERESVMALLDSLELCFQSPTLLKTIASKLSFVVQTINCSNENELKELFPIFQHFSVILHEYCETILAQEELTHLTLSYIKVLQMWFSDYFLKEISARESSKNKDSVIADFHTLTLLLGITDETETSASAEEDDIFF